MEIKYHQNGVDPEYGADHMLTNNWDPYSDYGNEYVNVHFRILTDGYGYPEFCLSKEQKEAVHAELHEVFTALGWEIKEARTNGGCQTATKGKSHLYLHPQDFSGEVLKREVKDLAEAFVDQKTFHLEWVDLYETRYDLTDETFEQVLCDADLEIRKLLLELCKTKRTKQYVRESDVLRVLRAKYGKQRLGYYDLTDGAQISGHITKIVDALVCEGLLVEFLQEDTRYLRTINKTEQKKLKKYIA